MSDSVILSIIGAVVAILQIWTKWDIARVHKEMNSMKDALVLNASEIGYAKGKEKGKEVEKAKQKEKDSQQ